MGKHPSFQLIKKSQPYPFIAENIPSLMKP